MKSHVSVPNICEVRWCFFNNKKAILGFCAKRKVSYHSAYLGVRCTASYTYLRSNPRRHHRWDKGKKTAPPLTVLCLFSSFIRHWVIIFPRFLPIYPDVCQQKNCLLRADLKSARVITNSGCPLLMIKWNRFNKNYKGTHLPLDQRHLKSKHSRPLQYIVIKILYHINGLTEKVGGTEILSSTKEIEKVNCSVTFLRAWVEHGRGKENPRRFWYWWS